MKFCPNCGKELPEGVNFCPYCGYKLTKESDEVAKKEKSKKMSKGVTKSLKYSDTAKTSETEVHAEKRITGTASRKEKRSATKTMQEDLESAAIGSIGKYSLPNNTIALYFILSFILLMGNVYSDEIMGIFIYTLIVLVIILIRRKKEKPFNWLLNIFIILQEVLVFAVGMMTVEYFEAEVISTDVVQLGLLVFLFVTILIMLYRGNKRR